MFVSEGDPIMVRTPPGAGPDAGKGFRAFDKETGDVVWEPTFPVGNVGSPITCLHGGKQYIVLPIGSLDSSGMRRATMLPEVARRRFYTQLLSALRNFGRHSG